LPFPRQRSAGYRYYWDNGYYRLSDAFTLSGIIRKEKPRKIIEVGSGFSSAVMLDTLDGTGRSTSLMFIDPFPDRLNEVLLPGDRSSSVLIEKPVQEVSLSEFDDLGPQDVLFIDSSHVAKVGSDVTFILLRILPRLRPGVLVHIHDIFYPASCHEELIRLGYAFNESIFLRAFLLGNTSFEIVAFNAFAGRSFPEIFKESFPEFLDDTGESLWLRRVPG